MGQNRIAKEPHENIISYYSPNSPRRGIAKERPKGNPAACVANLRKIHLSRELSTYDETAG